MPMQRRSARAKDVKECRGANGDIDGRSRVIAHPRLFAATAQAHQPKCARRLSQLLPKAIATRATTRTMASLSSQCDPGNAKAAACQRNTAKGTDRAARTASAALTALDLAADLTQDAIPAAATSARNPQRNVTASILGSGSAPLLAISTTPCASHKAPPASAAGSDAPQADHRTTVPHVRCDAEAARVTPPPVTVKCWSTLRSRLWFNLSRKRIRFRSRCPASDTSAGRRLPSPPTRRGRPVMVP